MPVVGDSDSSENVKPASTKAQISAITWVFIAVGAILVGAIVVIILWKTRAKNPFAIEEAFQVLQGVGTAVGEASKQVAAVDGSS